MFSVVLPEYPASLTTLEAALAVRNRTTVRERRIGHSRVRAHIPMRFHDHAILEPIG
jgi:hypothetical protein